jgi:hypothetical protein
MRPELEKQREQKPLDLLGRLRRLKRLRHYLTRCLDPLERQALEAQIKALESESHRLDGA